MAITRYQPWNDLNRLHSLVNWAFDPRYTSGNDAGSLFAGQWVPEVDIREEDSRFVLLVDVPGIDPQDIEVTMENGMLTIKGERKLEGREEEHSGYRRIERASGVFYRRFTLPETADPDQISARCNNGVLEVSIAKQAGVQPRRIEVNH